MIFSKKGREQRDLIIAYKQVFAGDRGKQVLFDILDKANVLNTHKGDPYLEGRRSLALDILHKCKVSLNQFDKLLEDENPIEMETNDDVVD